MPEASRTWISDYNLPRGMVPRLRASRSSSNACACIRLQNGGEESGGRWNEEDRVKINGDARGRRRERRGRRRGEEERKKITQLSG